MSGNHICFAGKALRQQQTTGAVQAGAEHNGKHALQQMRCADGSAVSVHRCFVQPPLL